MNMKPISINLKKRKNYINKKKKNNNNLNF